MGFSEARWAKGIAGENRVATIIEKTFNLKRTTAKNDIWDYWSETAVAEQKSRFDIKPDTYDEWLFPKQKIINCSKDVRQSILIYYFPACNRLFYCIYDKVLFANFKERYIWAEHTSNILIPRDCWTELPGPDDPSTPQE